jgi:hypothetical protein
MTRLDERAKRKAKPFYREDSCHPVVLADGQAWLIARPCWWSCPVFKDAKAVRVEQRFGYDHDTNELVEALAHADDDALVVSIVASIAAELLRRVYDLTEVELDSLLCFRADDPASLKWLRDVADVVTYQESTIPAEKLQGAADV